MASAVSITEITMCSERKKGGSYLCDPSGILWKFFCIVIFNNLRELISLQVGRLCRPRFSR